MLDPASLHEALLKWLREGLGLTIEEAELVLDGKTLRGTISRHRRTMQALSVLDRVTGGILAEHPIDPATNEAKTALQVLMAMVLDGKLIIGDAGSCDREICQEIVDSGGDYLVLVKDNQPTLHKPAQQAFAGPRSFSPRRQAPGV